MILCANPGAQYQRHKTEIDDAVHAALESGWFIKGPQVSKFESSFAQYVGADHAIGVANGTDAIRLALIACGVRGGDEVITVSHTAVATVSAIEQAGAVPVLVDIDPDSYLMDLRSLDAAFSAKTKAVVAVHLYGQALDLTTLKDVCKKRNVYLIEDCAQAHGALHKNKKVGSWGDAAAFSFYPTKNLGAIGDGGAVVSSDAKIAERVRLLREYGWKERYISDIPGVNSRLDELQAAILNVKLKHLDADNDARRRLAEFYRESLKDSPIVLPQQAVDSRHVYHLFVTRVSNRDRVLAQLAENGIQAGVHYPVPIHLQPAYKGKIKLSGKLLETERAAAEVLSLPMYPELSKADAEHVVEALIRIVDTDSVKQK